MLVSAAEKTAVKNMVDFFCNNICSFSPKMYLRLVSYAFEHVFGQQKYN